MKKMLILIILLSICGCHQYSARLNNYDPDKSFFIPEGAVLTWYGVPDKDLPYDLIRYEEQYRAICKLQGVEPNEQMMKSRVFKFRGVFVEDKIMKDVHDTFVQPDLRPTVGDYFWDFVLGQRRK